MARNPERDAVNSILRRVADFHLLKVDLDVIDAFVSRRPASGRILDTDGRSLSKMGLGGEKIAVWRGDRIAVVSSESVRSDDMILRRLVSVAGKGRITFPYQRPGHDLALRFSTGGDSFARDQYNGWIEALVPGRADPVGRLDWSVFQGSHRIEMVEVDPAFQRSGIATALYRELFRREGITKRDLVSTYRTDDGAAFRSRARIASRQGDCYLAAGRYVVDRFLSGDAAGSLRLVHAEVAGQGRMGGKTFGHAWVEDGETAIDLSNGRNIRLPVPVYRILGHVDEIGNVHEYTPKQVLDLSARTGHWGPWDLRTSSGL